MFSLEEADRLSNQRPQSVINNNVKQNPSSVKQITAELEGGEEEETGTLGTEKVGLFSTMKYNIECPLLLDFGSSTAQFVKGITQHFGRYNYSLPRVLYKG